MKKKDSNDLITAGQAAKILGVTPRQVLTYHKAGLLDAEPVHARLQLYTLASVEKLAKEPRPKGRPRKPADPPKPKQPRRRPRTRKDKQ